MKKFKKIYLEITNVCNLSCSFCPKTSRKPHFMTVEEFSTLAEKLRPHGDYLYLHVKGEPTLHPKLAEILAICEQLGFRVCITSNGTLLEQVAPLLLASKAVHKVHLSLHSFEASDLDLSLDDYLDGIVSLVKTAPFLVVLRLWNQGGADALNQRILEKLEQNFTFLTPTKITPTAYLQYGEQFEWADLNSETRNQKGFCYGLRDQIGVLVDGTVIPCCLDNDGSINLGNLFCQTVEEIYQSPRAKALYDGFSNRQFSESLCQSCGFIRRFG